MGSYVTCGQQRIAVGILNPVAKPMALCNDWKMQERLHQMV